MQLICETLFPPRMSVTITFLTYSQGCKRDLSLRDRDIPFLVRDETETKTFLQFHETETSDFCHETRPKPRPCKAETEMFFETFKVEHRCTHKFPYSTASKSFLFSNAFMAKSGAQTLTFNSVTNRQTHRQTDKNSTFLSAPAAPEIRAPPNLER